MRREWGVGSLYKGGTPVARGGATGPPVARGVGATCPLFFWELVANLKKKITLSVCRPMGATGGIFEIFQNGHIFLKFLFLKKYKKEKTARLHWDRFRPERYCGGGETDQATTSRL